MACCSYKEGCFAAPYKRAMNPYVQSLLTPSSIDACASVELIHFKSKKSSENNGSLEICPGSVISRQLVQNRNGTNIFTCSGPLFAGHSLPLRSNAIAGHHDWS
ncbi:Esterase/lipase [Pseudomonas syringae pv. actinidiae]|uniref:Esterase/lipase n=1 Tax=Pseudomonas syringae pv. actinidiae TaxID=103796 RepID=A0A2V0QII2_PSESF|nr:Esterase/lipase [Pseudomonas syringae pv. actinidiae]